MKKLFYWAAVLAILIGFTSVFVSCGSSNSPSSPSATPTATFTATPNPYTVLIIYGSNPTIVTNIGNLIDNNGYTSTSINMPSLVSGGSFNFGSYGKIILTSDTATTSPWGSTAIVNQIKASGVPVLGLGEGGALFFDTVGDTEIGFGDSQVGTNTTIGPQNPTGSLWTTPNAVSTSSGDILYSSNSSVYQLLYSSAPPSGTTLWGVTNTNYYPLASFTSGGLTYFEWGFVSDPSTMTTVGQNLFLNALKFI